MRVSKDLILFVFVIIGAAAAGVWVLEGKQTNNTSTQTPQNQVSTIERIPHAEVAPTKSLKSTKQQIEKQFEDFINDFLDDLKEKTVAYKEKRKIVRDLIKPVNVRTTAYLKENDALLEQLTTEMNADMDGIIASFDQADTDLKSLMSINMGGNQSIILEKWTNIKSDQLDTYISYFIFEKELLSAYRSMYDYYLSLGDSLRVDVAQNELVLSTPRQKAQYKAILDNIENIKQQSKNTLSNAKKMTPTKAAQN